MANRLTKNTPFTVAPNALIQDDNISVQARFLYIYMASMPNDWNFYMSHLAAKMQMTVKTLRKYTKELESKGWLTNEGQISTNGVFGANQYTIHSQVTTVGQFLPYGKKTATEKYRNGKNDLHTKETIQQKKQINKRKKREKTKEQAPPIPDDNFIPKWKGVCTASKPVDLKTGLNLWQEVYSYLCDYLAKNLDHVDNIRETNRFAGDVKPPLKNYLRKLQEKGDTYTLMPRTDSDEAFVSWLGKILAGWSGYVKNAKKWSMEDEKKNPTVLDTRKFKTVQSLAS